MLGIGTDLRGKFGGQLGLFKKDADPDVMNMLLDVPTGLRFTNVHIHGARVCLRPTLMLAEACGESLAKLTYMVDDYGESLLLVPNS